MPQSPEIFQDEIAAAFGAQAQSLAWLYAQEGEAWLRRLRPGSWNAAECLEHLSLTYEHYLPQLVFVSQGEKHGHARYHTSWHVRLLIEGLRPSETGKLRFKMKTFRVTDPAPIESEPRTAIERFRFLHAQFQHLAEALDTPAKLNRTIATLLGPWFRLRAGDAVKFLLAHNDRHLKQAARAMQDRDRGFSEPL